MKTEYELPESALYDATEDVDGYTAEQMQSEIHAAVLDERGEWMRSLLPILRSQGSAEQVREAIQKVIRNRSNT